MSNRRRKEKTLAKKQALTHTPDEFGRIEKDKQTALDTRPIIITGLQHERTKQFTETLTSESTAFALIQAEGGDMAAQMSLFEQMEEKDPSLAAAMLTRRSAVIALNRVMQPARTKDDPDFKKAEEIALDTAEVLEGIENFDGVLTDMLDGTGKGISVLENDYDSDGSICRIRHIPPILYNFDQSDGRFYIEYVQGQSIAAGMVRIYPDEHPYKFTIHRPKMRSGHPTRAGVLRTLVWCYVFRNYALKDQSVFCEVFGMPMRIGKYKRAAGNADKNQLAAMLRQMASDSWAVISEDTEIEFKDIVNRGSEPFSAFNNALRSEYFLAVLGQEATNVTNKYGTKGDSQVKQLVRQDILEADCKQVETTTKRDILFPIVMYRHGLDAARKYTPLLHFKYEPPVDLALMAATDKIVLIDMGAGKDVRRSDVLEKYGWERAPEGTKPEDMLVNPVAPVVPPPGAPGAPGKDGGPGTAPVNGPNPADPQPAP